ERVGSRASRKQEARHRYGESGQGEGPDEGLLRSAGNGRHRDLSCLGSGDDHLPFLPLHLTCFFAFDARAWAFFDRFLCLRGLAFGTWVRPGGPWPGGRDWAGAGAVSGASPVPGPRQAPPENAGGGVGGFWSVRAPPRRET